MSNDTKILIGVGVAIAVLFVVLVSIASQQKDSKSPVAVEKEILVRPDSHGTASLPTRVTIAEFGDYQCPACGGAHPLVQELLKEYSGKITLVYRHFPLDAHQHARSAAKAAEAAALQGKFWEMHNMLYENQSEWTEERDPIPVYLKYAKTLQLNIDQFSGDMTSDSVANRILQDLKDGQRAGVNATPTFFINSEKHVGVPSKEFKDLLDAALKSQ